MAGGAHFGVTLALAKNPQNPKSSMFLQYLADKEEEAWLIIAQLGSCC